MPTKGSQTSAFYKYSAATQGCLIWGVWAFYINSKTSLTAGIISGLAQGLFSFIATLLVVAFLTKLFNYFTRPMVKWCLPTLIMVIVLAGVSTLIHVLVGTPEIIKTIFPSLSMATLFCGFTTYKLVQALPET